MGRQKGREKVRDGVRDRHRDARKTARERKREVERKCDLVWVFWAACSICPPWQRGRVTGIGRNWISRLNTPSFPSSFFPISSPLLTPLTSSLFSSTYSPVSLTGEMWWRLQAEMFLPSVAKNPLSQVRLIGWLNIQQWSISSHSWPLVPGSRRNALRNCLWQRQNLCPVLSNLPWHHVGIHFNIATKSTYQVKKKKKTKLL